MSISLSLEDELSEGSFLRLLLLCGLVNRDFLALVFAACFLFSLALFAAAISSLTGVSVRILVLPFFLLVALPFRGAALGNGSISLGDTYVDVDALDVVGPSGFPDEPASAVVSEFSVGTAAGASEFCAAGAFSRSAAGAPVFSA